MDTPNHLQSSTELDPHLSLSLTSTSSREEPLVLSVSEQLPTSFGGPAWDKIHTDITNRYTPLEFLRTSSSHVVVKAKDKETNEFVVLKIVNTILYRGFMLEARLPCILHLPHTLSVTRLFESPYGALVFPFENSHLCYPESWKCWLRVLQQLFETLVVLHQNHYAHSDIKPSNILLRGTGPNLTVFLIDFGLVETAEDMLSDIPTVPTGNERDVTFACGTYPFTDPLLMETEVRSVTSDIWSIGVMVALSVLVNPYFPRTQETASVFHQRSKDFPAYFRLQAQNLFSIKQEMYDPDFLAFVQKLLVVDVVERLTATAALRETEILMKTKLKCSFN